MLTKLTFLRQKLAIRWFLPCLFLFSTPSLANLPNKTSQITSTSQLTVQVFLGLMLVLAIIFSLAWLAKRMHFMPNNLQAQGVMRPLASLQLGPKERLMLVEVGQEQLLIGVTSQQISLIHQLNQPLALPSHQNKPVFADFLAKWVNTKTPPKKQED